MHKIAKSICCLLFAFVAIAAQNSDSWKAIPRLKSLMQEKLYLHFDKPAYVAGERMWFRAYLANADTHLPDTASCAVYVELLNNVDSLIQRIKIPHRKGLFAASLLLSDALPEGNYSVRAYTNWMRNAGSDYFFNQSFFVGNSLSSQVLSTINYRFVDKKKAFAELQFMQGNAPLAGKQISYYINVSGNAKTPKTVSTTADGKLIIEYNPSKIDIKKPLIHVAYTENLSSYQRNYLLPAGNDFDCQFFAEGGALIIGKNNRVAFKAIQLDGLSTAVSGKIFDQNNKKISEFKSTHLGMGNFYFSPDSGMQYFALVKNAQGDEKRFELPPAHASSIALTATQLNGKIFIGINTNMPQDSMYLLAHSRSAVFYDKLITNWAKPVVFRKKDMRPGILSFLLIDKAGQVLSERLVFVRPDSMPSVQLHFDKPTYGKRERVNCHIQVLNAQGKPVEGSFSLSATDASDVQLHPAEQNLASYLLLSSDLRGHIEQPSSYFDPSNKKAIEQLDILMQTQGWKRFDVQSLLKAQKEEPKHFLEKGQAVSGLVKAGILNRAKKGSQVHILGPSIQYFSSTETDSLGRFEFAGFQFPDSTEFTVKALQKRGIKDAVQIFLDQDTFPSLAQNFVRPEQARNVSANQLEASKQKFFTENGILSIQLQDFELVESASRNDNVADAAYLNSVLDTELSGASLRKFDNLPFSLLVKSLPGLSSWSEYTVFDDSKIYAEDSQDLPETGPFFAWEGEVYSYQEVRSLFVGDLEAVRVMKKISAKSKTPADDILIVLIFKKDKGIYNSKYVEQNFERFMPLGYARAVEFYQPKYDVEATKASTKADWRSTLLWQAELKTDAQGRATCWFYTADRPSRYNLQLQGLTPQGEPCHFEGSYQLLKP